jgi:hypothetical protein
MVNHQQRFVDENAALDRAYLNGKLGECVGSLYDTAMEALDDDQPSGDGESDGPVGDGET